MTWQGTPFKAKSMGGMLSPVQVPLKPSCTDPPDATVPFQDSFSAVTWPASRFIGPTSPA